MRVDRRVMAVALAAGMTLVGACSRDITAPRASRPRLDVAPMLEDNPDGNVPCAAELQRVAITTAQYEAANVLFATMPSPSTFELQASAYVAMRAASDDYARCRSGAGSTRDFDL